MLVSMETKRLRRVSKVCYFKKALHRSVKYLAIFSFNFFFSAWFILVSAYWFMNGNS